MDILVNELKAKIVETLNLIDVTPDEIDPAEPLVGGTLGIDSIDVLELVMMIEKDYAVKIDNKEVGAQVFASVNAMAGYISEHRPQRLN